MFKQHPILLHILFFLGILLLTWAVMHAVHAMFRRVQQKQDTLHLVFFDRISRSAILIIGIILAFSVFGGINSVWKTLLGGTAIISTVLAFAAQDVIKDILAGMMISIYKPFEIGSRVELEDGTAGIIQDITMRHVVIQGLDTMRIVIPNSKLNTMQIRNFSYHTRSRSIRFEFRIGYGSDAEKAIEVIRQAVKDSEYSIPFKDTPHGKDYADVYFLAYEESGLKLATTVFFKPIVASEVVMTDINLRVGRALKENGIEIPYPYLNVVQKKESEE